MPTRVPPRGSLLDGHVSGKYIISPNSLLLGFLMQPLTWLPWCWLVWPPSSDLKWCWLPLAPFMWGWVLVGVAAFLGRRSRCLRAASAEPTRAYAVEPRQIPRNHLSYSYKFLCIASCTYSGNYDYLCRNKLVDNVHIPSHLKNANKHLPTRLAYAKKI